MTANLKIAERKCYINGQFVAGKKQFPKTNPVDGSVVAQVHEADRATVDQAALHSLNFYAEPTNICIKL